MIYNSVWRVEGKRVADGGIEHTILSTAFGPEEADARRWFDKFINGKDPHGPPGETKLIWSQKDLTFTREASWTK